MTQETTAPDVLYIMGTGRSGTTILEILLAASDSVSGVGEVTHLFRDGYSGAERCACGQDAMSCRLWSTVWHTCNWQESQIEDMAALSRRFAWHSRFPAMFFGLTGARAKHKFRKLNSELFSAVANQTGTTTIVDSSKYATRALAMARYYPGSVKIICLTRSPEGLATAFSRQATEEQKPKTPLGTLLYYCYTLACFRVVRLVLRRKVLAVRYEDLRANPAAVMEKIADWCGVSLHETIRKLGGNEAFETGHILTGNRLRRQETVRFKVEPKRELSPPPGTRWSVALMRIWRFLMRF